jgi:hypothetical protein
LCIRRTVSYSFINDLFTRGQEVCCREIQLDPARGGRMPPATELESDIGVQRNHYGRVDRGVFHRLGR